MLQKLCCVLFITLYLAGCSHPVNTQANQSTLAKAPPIVQKIPKEVQGYHYVAFKDFGGAMGLSLRYDKEKEIRHNADVYVWSVPENLKEESHRVKVYVETIGALKGIFLFAEAGHYSNIKFLEKGAYGVEEAMTTVHKMSMRKSGEDILSFLYVSEYQGHMLKVRISMLDTGFNRARKDMNQFVHQIFTDIIAILKEQSLK